MKKLILILLMSILFAVSNSTAQVAINSDGTEPNSKAMLDISSSTTGLLIPRMTNYQRNIFEATLTTSEKGMMVFNTDTDVLYFYDGTAFNSISNGVIDLLQDADGNTKIEVEKTSDEDVIHFTMDGTEYYTMYPGRMEVLNTGSSIFIGEDAGENDDNTDNKNIGIGTSSLKSNISGSRNLAIGKNNLYSNSSGYTNVALGYNNLVLNVSGHDNVALGSNSLYNNNGNYNTAIGVEALFYNTTGSNNSSIGEFSLKYNTTGSYNTSIGRYSLFYNTTGSHNIAIGAESLLHNTSASGNTAIGYESLYNSNGEGNMALGYKSGRNITTGSNNITIGYKVYAPSPTNSNQMSIGNLIFGTGIDGTETSISSGNVGIGVNNPSVKLDVRGDLQLKNLSGEVNLFLNGSSGNSEVQFQRYGDYRGAVGYNFANEYLYLYEGGSVVLKNGNFGIGTTTPGHRLQVGNSGDGSTARGNAWNTFSDRRLKKDLRKIDNPLDKLFQLNGYYYFWIDTPNNKRQIGVIAQEVEEVLPEIVSSDDLGIKSVDYSKLTALLIEAVKEQQETIKKLEERIVALER